MILPDGPADDSPVDKSTFPVSPTLPLVLSANTLPVEDVSATLPPVSSPSMDNDAPDEAIQKLRLDINVFRSLENFMIPPISVDKSMEPPARMDTHPVEAETASAFPALMLTQPLSP
jgi:hypothetical protein